MENNKNICKAYFASGCFWGTEYWFSKAAGVKATTVGFMGGNIDHPTYREVCTGTTGHLECVEVEYDTDVTNYENLLKLFFETHNFSQTNGQGPDIGSQYLSCIFYFNQAEKQAADRCIDFLRKNGYSVATQLRRATTFWRAEDYHQQYYKYKGTRPYCHIYRKIFK
ncbi:MAG: peptide-methionine (S)-S-oxide reductase MsrA [Paludibacter sp.]|nr:peptide-methionine (S)-S-oxide reductase MsrA [Paludibacter sp.]